MTTNEESFAGGSVVTLGYCETASLAFDDTHFQSLVVPHAAVLFVAFSSFYTLTICVWLGRRNYAYLFFHLL
jgi:hypothetical protein